MEEDTKSKEWISDGIGNRIKLKAITAITIDCDFRTYKTVVHFDTGSLSVHSEWYSDSESRRKCQKVADDIFAMLQEEK